ncbi:sugar porter family MFS transporter [Acidiferrimicrobium sp. IK]|uniref:sugar porter family MFS transporter n=1 Tax=Acidiferrimicrobium sp. IK TaxID=2871700 RepID=UPI0021CB542D|nr:sugar porter family MFS transporter [Acidiferrimicrobium sp. IK]MCU4187000.1 sugar porter family MFS transporter [Acidiferrimicrobium sp. IK]
MADIIDLPDTTRRDGGGGTSRAVVVASAVTALGGLLFGYDTGVVSGALLFLQKSFGHLSAFDRELVTSLLLVGAAVGALGAGRLADRIGRRTTVILTAAVFVVGVLAAALSPVFPFLVATRFVIGVAVGSASMVVPMYIGEVAPPRYRGALVSFNQLAITSGILVSYLVDYGLSSSQNWRLMFGLAAIPAALLGAGMLTQSESPQWLVAQGRDGEARDVLARLRRPEEVEREIEVLDRNTKAAEEELGSRALLAPKLRGLLTVGVLMAVFQQVTGINTVIYYAPTLLSNAGFGSSSALLANVVNGGVNVGMTIVAIWLLDRVGRRVLLLSGTSGMVVGLTTVGLTFLIGGDHLHGGGAVVAIAGLLVYTGSFAVGLGPVFWLMISEIYPSNVRASAMSIATIANWAANFAVTVSFLTLLNAITNAGTFFLFAGLTVVALAYFAVRVPETKGRTLGDVEERGAKAAGRAA